MKRQPGEPEIWTTKRAAREVGVLMSNLTQVAGLPEPYDVTEGGRLWRADEIRTLTRERNKRMAAEARRRARKAAAA